MNGGRAGGRVLRLAAALLLVAGPAAAQVPQADEIIAQAAAHYRVLRSLRAEFAQTIADPMVGTFNSRGTLVQSGDNKLAMRFSDPRDDAIVIDGESIWLYTPSTTPNQVIRRDLPGGGPVYGYNLLGWFLDRPAERYDATFVREERAGGRTLDVVTLTPLNADMPFRRATLAIDQLDHLPRRIEIEEKSGARRTLALSQLRTNVAVEAGTFVFRAPQGTRVVRQ